MKSSTLLAILFCCTISAAADDLLIADFESETYGDWTVTGEAFGPGPAAGRLPNQMDNLTGYEGRRLVNSFYGGDDSTGTLTSPPFTIQRRYINFLIGGGMHPGRTCISLLVDGKIVHTATGPNDRPGGTEALDWHTWDVSDLYGKTARIEILDQQKGGWGHINVDHIYQSDTKAAAEKTRDILLDKRYLNLPVKTGAPKRRISLLVDNRTVREFEIELADAEPDFYCFLDVTAWRGKHATVKVNALSRSSRGLANIACADTILGAENLYREPLRQQFHFSSRRGWLNDSNGLVWHDGKYHLYYQHNPYGWAWGNMHWGHAVSADLVHWTELPIAIYPRAYGDWAFSGSAVVDRANTAGFKTGTEDVIVAAWTSTGRGECIAYSNDGGLTFTEYPDNPVVKHRGRDPKVIWYAPGKHWSMAVYDETDNRRAIAFYTSPDLKNWKYESAIDGFFECPEIFELPIDGDRANTRWVLYAADGEYMLGAFDGKTFAPETAKIRFDYGNCFYASQTYNDIPASDGRRIQIAWGRIPTPGMSFNQCMLFPTELTLRTTDEGLRMFAVPVREIATLHKTKHEWKNRTIKPGENPLSKIQGELFHITADLQTGNARQCGLTIRGTTITYDAEKNTLTCLDRSAPLKPQDGRITLELLIDRNSIEIFANHGRIYMPIGKTLPDDNKNLALFAREGSIVINALTVCQLNSAWR
ncbi:MAG TPA: GH32 C-terminal domain-containing protein [Anaerohalosphaeraceae bacterium]|jgi:fructan beta-fructosidase|nr:GH32 C-terminal domain-containing protein [Anaerohalosphaeraceae bacterium]HRT51075.1 GH32 C-terminal domain-containing protein [Anaerohalosphaeraceae bacterium]HRT87090.1 GH32 C-terminal domain-containing protein [Anaerohalosphaeraceae bacterium]